MKPGFVVALLVPLAGCFHPGPAAPTLHYVLGDAYQAGGVWYYPRESFDLDETGLAMVTTPQEAATADGEAYDAGALAASHPTLQLPALAQLTNLENGRQVLVRLNDRGPGTPTRMIGITRRTALLLAAADSSAIRVRLRVLQPQSEQMADALRPAGPQLAVATEPAQAISSETLAPPPGARAGSAGPLAGPTAPVASAVPVAAPAVPLRLPEQVIQGVADPGRLEIDCGGFSTPEPANILRARLATLGAYATTDYYAPRDRAYIVRIGPLGSVAAADATLRRALAAGATDARIVVITSMRE